MLDLYFGLAIVLTVAGAMWALGNSIAGRISYLWIVVAIVGIVSILAWLRSDPDRLWLARLLPFSNLIVIGNLMLPAVALVCGMAFCRLTGQRLRRCLFIAPLILLAAYDLARPLLGNPPSLGNAWQDGVCRQTSNESCSAAAAATLLHSYGIQTTEGEMAALCLTRPGGTSAAGIYRGLKLKTAGHPLHVHPFHSDLASLRAGKTPVLLTVELRPGPGVDPRYAREWGWTPNVAHTVVLFRFLPNDRIEIGDPDIGHETWNMQALRVLWHGNGIRLDRE